jgi:hypothetical protein
MQRIKIYDVPHKGLRNALSHLSLRAGNTNYSDKDAVAELYQLGCDVFRIMTVHAEDENNIGLAALEARCPGASQHDMDDHEHIEAKQAELEKLLTKIHADVQAGKDAAEDGAEFYLAFSEFHGEYLAHTAEEERVTQPLIWQHFSDEEILAQRMKILGNMPPDAMQIWARFIVPALSEPERTGFLAGLEK